jgi:hypothetical protein
MEITHEHGQCIMWGCDNFAGKDEDGTRHGIRGMCFKCYSRARRSSDFVLIRPVAKQASTPRTCTVCGSDVIYMYHNGKPYCRYHHPERAKHLAAKARSMARYREQLKKKAAEHPELVPHGTPHGYSNWCCRCFACSQAHYQAKPSRKLKRKNT